MKILLFSFCVSFVLSVGYWATIFFISFWKKSSAWQPIDTAPMWQRVIIYDPDASRRKSDHKVYTAVLTEKGWDLAGKTPKRPTYWQPLPSPPEESYGHG